jgi:hypothetical protein
MDPMEMLFGPGGGLSGLEEMLQVKDEKRGSDRN